MTLVRQDVRAPRQRGMVLIVVLVLLGIFTLIVAALVRTGNINFRIVGNQQYQQEALLAAQKGLETYVTNSANFSTPPSATLTDTLDLDGDGVSEYSAQVPPATCIGSRVVTNAELTDIKVDRQCRIDLSYNQQMSGAPQTNCKDLQWDIKATVNDTATTGASVEVHQGVNVRSKVNVSCP